MNMCILKVLFIPLLCEITLANAAEGTEVPLYETHEISWKMENAPDAAEFRSNANFYAIFTCGEMSLTLPGYWAGKDKWTIRFCPTRTGQWDYMTVSNLSGLNGLRGSIQCIPSSNKGFLRVDLQSPYTLSYSNGIPAWIWGNTAYEILAPACKGDVDVWHRFVDESKAHGMGKLRILVTMWNFGASYRDYESARYYPWLDCTVEKPTFKAFNAAYWDRLDEVVRYLKDRDMVAELILFPDYCRNPQMSDPGLIDMTAEEEFLYTRYAIARYAAFPNVIWCLGNEWNIFDSLRTRFGGPVPKEWAETLGNFVRTIDPYIGSAGRLLSIHSKTYIAFPFISSNWPTHFVLQYGKRNKDGFVRGHDWGNAGIVRNLGHKKPVFNDEYAYDGEAGPPFVISREMARKAAWGVAIAGGYGTYAEWHEPAPGSGTAVWHEYPSQDDIRMLHQLMTSVDYRHMAAHNELILDKPKNTGAYLLANPGREYLMYAADGPAGPFRIMMRPGQYKSSWISPTSGKVLTTEMKLIIGEEKEIVIDSPAYKDDILLYIRNELE